MMELEIQIPENFYYDSSEVCDIPPPEAYMIFILDVITVASIPIHVVVFVAFARKSPAFFTSYKKKLLFSAIWDCFNQYMWVFMIRPLFYFPTIAVRACGAYLVRHSSAFVVFIILVGAVLGCSFAIFELFKHRMESIVEPWGQIRCSLFYRVIQFLCKLSYLMFIGVMFCSILFFLEICDQPIFKSRSALVQQYPEIGCGTTLLLNVSSPYFQIIDVILIICFLVIAATCFLMMFFSYHVLRKLKKFAKASKATQALHHKFLVCLCVQSGVFLSFLTIPGTIYIVAFLLHITNHKVSFLGVCLVSCHGAATNLSSFLLNGPLRESIFQFNRGFREASRVVSITKANVTHIG